MKILFQLFTQLKNVHKTTFKKSRWKNLVVKGSYYLLLISVLNGTLTSISANTIPKVKPTSFLLLRYLWNIWHRDWFWGLYKYTIKIIRLLHLALVFFLLNLTLTCLLYSDTSSEDPKLLIFLVAGSGCPLTFKGAVRSLKILIF